MADAAFATLYGTVGCGSAIVEALAALAGLRLEFVQADPTTAAGRPA